MNDEQILKLFEQTGALLTGHFILTSGLHSRQYFQCAQVLKHPDMAAQLCAQIAQNFRQDHIELVIAPAVGGIIVAHEVARALGVSALFAEREQGQMTLRRGFRIEPDQRVLVVEDVITTGGSVKEVVELVRWLGGNPVAAACIVDRSAGAADLGVPYRALVSMKIETYPPDDPRLRELGPATKPGSRALGKNG